MREVDVKPCLDLLREHSRADYLTCLLLPAPLRDIVAVLRAFHVEVAAIALRVSEPMPGEIRLQWWRDIVNGERASEAAAHPVARALLAAMEAFELPAAVLEAKLEAHVFDLYGDPMPDTNTMEGYAGETRSILYQLPAMALSPGDGYQTATAAGHAGVAEMLADILRTMPLDRARKRQFIPETVLAQFDVSNGEYVFGGIEDRAAPIVAHLCDMADEHLSAARLAGNELKPEIRSAFIRLVHTEMVVKSARKTSAEVVSNGVRLSPLALQWNIWRASRRCGF